MDLRARLQTLLDADYTIERELGGGGMSRVFVAVEKKLGRRVVIKVLSSDLAATLSTGRFEREIQLAASLQQANIVPVLTTGNVEGMPWYTMPFVEGESLRVRLSRGPLPEREALSVLRDVARALVYAHERGIVHRDIKPDNVLISGEAAVVTDFGIAKAISAARAQAGPQATGITQVGTSIGTPAYMAPEQAAGDPDTDHRADLYAFGCMAFELLTGRPPFNETAPHKLLAAHLGQTAPRLRDALGSVTQALDTLVATCLEKSPGDRPQSAREVLAQIDAALSGSGSGAASIALARQTSLPKAIAIWAASFVATWILARAAVVGIGLPDWTVPLALVVAGLGLPAVLITWYVQRTARRALLMTPIHTPGGTQAYGTMATMALKAAPVVSWKRTWRGGLVGGGAVIVAVAVVMVLRAFGLGPAASLLNAGAIGKDSRVVVAQFTSSTADTSLGTVVSAAMRTSLGQSKAIQLVSPGDVVAGLQRMKLPVNATLDEKTAQMFAMRDGIPLVVTGTVSPVGTGYMVTANLVRADSGIALVTEQRAATGVGDLLDAVDKVAKGLRSRIGESLRSLARAPSLERATTSSLVALRDYSRAVELGDLHGEFDKAMPLLRQAVKEDSTFAQAWRKLAAYVVSAGGSLSEAFNAAAAAYRFRERLPDDERFEVEAYYTRELSTKAGADYYAAHTDFLSQNNRGISLYNLGQFAAAESVLKAQIASDQSRGRKPIVQLRTNLMWALVLQNKIDEARTVLEETKREFPASQAVELGDTWISGVASLDTAAAVSAKFLRSKSARVRAQTARNVAAYALAQGRLKKGVELDRVAIAVEDTTKFNDDPVGNAADVTVAVTMARGASADGARILDSLAGRIPKDASWLDRPDLRLAAAYAQVGRVDKAKALVGEFERSAKREERLVQWGSWQLARAEIALAEGRAADAIATFRRATVSDSGSVEPAWTGRMAFGLARAHDKANQPDSAIAWFDNVRAPHLAGGTAISAPLAIPVAARRLGELYEAKGDVTNAIKSYEEFVKLWKDADPELQPQVADIKARITRLRAKEAAKR
jgi:tetratricopeptide (TPR) repeat protein